MRAQEDSGTRERILSVAAFLFAVRGYHGTRLHDIASRVGIQKASLFHHFPSKAELYRAALGQGVAEAGEVIRAALESERPAAMRVRDLVSAYVGLVARHPERTKLFLRFALGDAPVAAENAEGQRLVAAVAEFVARGQQGGVFRPLDPVALVLGVVGMVAFLFTVADILSPAWRDGGGLAGRIERAVTDIALRALCAAPESGPGAYAAPAPAECGDALEP
jgi:TetR/AcrR family transcriptional regulator